MTEERDVVVFTDDDGKDFEMEVLDYFFYNGQEYAVLTEVCDHDDIEDDEHQHEAYIMQVVQMDDDMEEFVPIDDDLAEELIKVAEAHFDEEFEDEDEEEDEDDEEEEE
jgi:hypothetical protein